jgi:arginyl-tRNA--protein-N-Asp/Glu arginylyltransferase
MYDSQLEDERMRAEENILNTHLEAVKEEAQLIQREGEMITTLERAIMNEEEYDMREYLQDARHIAMQKI